MIGGLAAAEVVVVHTRQVIVNQGHRVYHLHSARRRHCLRFEAADELAGGDTEHRPDPLAAGEQRVPHGLVYLRRVPQRNGVVEGLVDRDRLVNHVGLEIELGFLFRALCFFSG